MTFDLGKQPLEQDGAFDHSGARGELYLVWSNEHRGWWGPGRCGYSVGLQKAGRYNREQALDICRGAIATAGHLGAIAEIPVRERDVRDFLAGQMIPSSIITGAAVRERTAIAEGTQLKGGLQRRIAVTMDKPLFFQIRTIAMEDGRSLSDTITVLIKQALKARK